MGQKGMEKFIVILMGNPEWLEEEEIFKKFQLYMSLNSLMIVE